jgi:two-component system, cell cycle response regulator CpdR
MVNIAQTFLKFPVRNPNHLRRRLLILITPKGGSMTGPSKPLRATVLVVEDDHIQREMLGLLLEESQCEVIECESAEAAEMVLQRCGENLALMMTDVGLAGPMNGVELAHIARRCHPALDVIVTSGRQLPRRGKDGPGSGGFGLCKAPPSVLLTLRGVGCARLFLHRAVIC